MAIHHFPNSLHHTDHLHHHHHHHHGDYNFSSLNFSLLSNPLFSTILTLYLLILLYFPHFFLTLLLSPLFISTLILLLSLLRCGVSHQTPTSAQVRIRPDPEPVETEVAQVGSHCKETQSTPEPEPEPKHHIIEAGRCSSTRPESDPNPNPYCGEWGVGAPLEVIYEAYEGEEEGDEDQNDASSKENCAVGMIARTYPSLDRYYPESDTDSDSDSGSSLSWWNEEEEEREGLIEIDLDHDHDHGDDHKEMRKPLEYLGQADEEDNLIEIDISPNPITANYGFSW